MDKRTIEELREAGNAYIQSLQESKCNPTERSIRNLHIENEGHYFSSYRMDEAPIHKLSMQNPDELIRSGGNIPYLLQGQTSDLELYLRRMVAFSPTEGVYRIDVRGGEYESYREGLKEILLAFYIYHSQGWDMETLILGGYKDAILGYSCSFSPVISAALMRGDTVAIEAVQRVLVSENNVGILTREVITAIEENEIAELHDTLLELLRAARLQEGLRQSIAECGNEYSLTFYLKLIDVVAEEGFLRYSSIRRAVQTWCGLGYETVDDKDIPTLFEGIRRYLLHPEARQQAYQGVNALEAYVALYACGAENLQQAIEDAQSLIRTAPMQLRIAAIYYLRRSTGFNIWKHPDLVLAFPDDPFLLAFACHEMALLDDEYQQDITIDCATAERLFDLIEAFGRGVKSGSKFTFGGFEWFVIALDKSSIYNALHRILIRSGHTGLTDRFLALKAPAAASIMNRSYVRDAGNEWDYHRMKTFLKSILPTGSRDARVGFLLQNTLGSESALFELLAPVLKEEQLSEAEIKQIEAKLSSKKSSTRFQVVKILQALPAEQLVTTYERLRDGSNENAQNAAAELLRECPMLSERYGAGESVSLDTSHPTEYPGEEEGYGLYTPSSEGHGEYKRLMCLKEIKQPGIKGLFKSKTEVFDLSALFRYTEEEVLQLFRKFDELIDAHATDEYQPRWSSDGSMTQLGYQYLRLVKDEEEDPVGNLPFPDLWRNFFSAHQITQEDIFGLYMAYLYCSAAIDIKIDSEQLSLMPLGDRLLEYTPKYDDHLETVLGAFFRELKLKNPSLVFNQSMLFVELIYNHCPFPAYKYKRWNDVEIKSSITSIKFYATALRCCEELWRSEEDFKRAACLLECIYLTYTKRTPLDTEDKYQLPVLMAAKMPLVGINLPKDALIELLMNSYYKQTDKSYYSSSNRPWANLEIASRLVYRGGRWGCSAIFSNIREDERYSDEVYEYLRSVVTEVMEHLLKVELTRINAPTPVSKMINSLGSYGFVLRGTKHLLAALAALGKEHLVRSVNTWSSQNERKEVLTVIISGTYPLDTDTPDMLQGITDERLIELAFFAPQWLPLVEAHLGWLGFITAYYYFVAHTKDMQSDEKKAQIALYTDLEPDELNDGAFDRNFFFDTYNSVGEERFGLLYKAAKYLTSNANHSRARKYADASLGLLDKNSLIQDIETKRNKDSLNAYCLVPIKDDADLSERYRRIQSFLKESKQFGSQRQESEKRAAEIALLNLARTSRFEEPIRLSWMMEAGLVESHADCIAGIEMEGYTGRIEIDEQGRNTIVFDKEGKTLKTIPAKVKKTAQYLHLNQVHKMWTEQYRRARRMLESAMEVRQEFGVEELKAIGSNPIIAPMLSKLLVAQGSTVGLYEEEHLRSLSGIEPLQESLPVRIIHPYDLYSAKTWRDWQRLIFERQMVQPFKQVFRELYLQMEDEGESNNSRRYSGYQIQVKQALGALKSRGWSADYERGLRKVYYKQGIVVGLYAEADWFSPGDIEAPAIEYVEFSHRKGCDSLKIKDIDPVLYSEVMRDIDMAVSIAYVGGVDPETGFSTRELRGSIVACTADLFKHKNVEVTENFVNIEGSLAKYSVHLGSGIVRIQAGGQLPILAVHSQHRGKLYLPFLDEDPKTAEIVSKVILLAEDNKIKDPTILRLIKA